MVKTHALHGMGTATGLLNRVTESTRRAHTIPVSKANDPESDLLN